MCFGYYSTIYTFQLDTAVDSGAGNPMYANAVAIDATDDFAYGKFSFASGTPWLGIE